MMSEFKGTKGPWDWDNERLGSKTMLVFGKNYPVEMTSKENKALIAAAPDLLAALQYIVDPLINDLPIHSMAYKQAVAAIAKALGETK